MASSDEEPIRAIQAPKAEISHAESAKELKEPLPLSKRGSAQLATAPARKPKYGGLPTFHLQLEGLGGKKLAAVWVT